MITRLQNEYSAVEKCPCSMEMPNLTVHGKTIIITDTSGNRGGVYVPRPTLCQCFGLVWFFSLFMELILGHVLNWSRILLCLCCTTEVHTMYNSEMLVILTA